METPHSTSVFQGELSSEDVSQRAIYLGTIYKDSKESFKQLIALISAVLVAYGTLGSSDDELVKYSVFLSLTLSLVTSVLGYYLLKCAGEKATNLNFWDYGSGRFSRLPYARAALWADRTLEISGALFIVGLIIFVITRLFV